jgi:hypothetical protein
VEHNELENQSRLFFQGLKPVQPSPYFAARVAANLKSRKQATRQLRLWKWLSALSFTAVIGLVIMLTSRPKPDVLFAYQPYVIQVKLDESDIQLASRAEVELPEGVNFVSRNQVVRSLRSLSLPLHSKRTGIHKLPFVILSTKAGSFAVRIRLYDSSKHLIDTKTMNLRFAGERKG